jgi:hypothetical protein
MAWQALLDDLRRHVLASLGVAPSLLLAACGSSAIGYEDEGGVTTDPSGDGSSVDDGAEGTSDSGSPSTSTSTSATTTADSGSTGPTDSGDGDGDDDSDDTGNPGPFDIASIPDGPAPAACTITETPATTLDEHPECPIVLDVCSALYWGCVELPPDQTCQRLCPDGDCVIDWWTCSGDPVWDVPNSVCGPYEIDGMCCSLADIGNFCGTDGRPFVVGGIARTAELRTCGGSIVTRGRLPKRVLDQLAQHWTAIARAEHASVASFAQFGARLLALAAPPELLFAALYAANDEVRHAEFALARASEFAGRSLVFGPLDTREANRASESFEQTVLACVREGCIGETLAALELGAAAIACADPELAASLRSIADDEARHAALAWRFVRWALDQQPGLAPAVAAVFDSLIVPAPATERFAAHERELLRAHGCLPATDRRRVQLEGLRELLRPCAAALLGGLVNLEHDRPTHGGRIDAE